MTLYELKAEIGCGWVEAVDDVLLERGEERWSVFHEVILGQAWVVGIFDDAEAAQASWAELGGELPEGAVIGVVVGRELAGADWRDSYKLHFKPWTYGRLHWVPEWERVSYELPEGAVAIWLDPGLAFGTGNHETTRLCCERLVDWAGARGTGGRVIDAGCGSGILALSAAALGFARVAGFDNDEEAVRVSEENAGLNGLEGRVDFYTGDLVTGLAGREAEVVLANIQADVLMRFPRELTGAVAPGGLLVLSGILGFENESVRAAFAAVAPDWEVEHRVMGEWSDVALRRPE